jgi:hypothetical protein
MTAKRCEEMTANGATASVKIVSGQKYSRNRRISTWVNGTLTGLQWNRSGKTNFAYALVLLDGQTETTRIHPSLVQPA